MKKSMIISKEMVTFAELNKQSMMKRTILTLVALLSMVAQFSYGQKELSIKEMEDSMALGNLNIQVDHYRREGEARPFQGLLIDT